MRRALVAVLAAALAACGSEPPPSAAPVLALVFVDGVAAGGEGGGTSLPPESPTRGGYVGARLRGVSTCAAATLASALHGVEPAEHGLMSIREPGAARAHGADPALGGADAVRVCVTTPRELSPEVAELGVDFDRREHLATRDLDAAFDAFDDALQAPLADGRPTIAVLVVERPPVRAPWPPGLVERVADTVAPLAREDPDLASDLPERDDLDAWYGRRFRTRFGDELDAAFERAWRERLRSRLVDLSDRLAAATSHWSVAECGLRTAGAAAGDVDLDERLPFAAVGAPAPLFVMNDLVGVRRALDAFVAGSGFDAAGGAASGDGLWRGVELVGERGRWRAREVAVADAAADATVVLVEPAVSGLRLELAEDAAPVEAVLTADEEGLLRAAVRGASAVLPRRDGRELRLGLEPGEAWEVHTATRAPRLLVEVSRAGVALGAHEVAVADGPLAAATLPRVLDPRGPELDAGALASRAELRFEDGRPRLDPRGVGRLEGARLFAWPALDEPAPPLGPPQEAVATARATFPVSSRRAAVLVRAADDAPGAGDGVPGYLGPDALAVEGRAPRGDALRLLWPPSEPTRSPGPRTGPPPAGTLRLSAIGPPVRFSGHPPRALRAYLDGLRPHQ